MLCHGMCPDDINKATIIPVPKNKRKSLNDSSNYRAIALGNVFCKLLDLLILIQTDSFWYPVNCNLDLKRTTPQLSAHLY